VISTGDKDMAQLVNGHVSLVNTMSNEVLDEAGVLAKFGVPPNRFIDYLSLIGDTVDNVPGVPKVGPKTAVKWLTEYDSLDNIIASADKIGGVVGQNLRDTLQWLPMARQLVTIKCDVALDVGPADLANKISVSSETAWLTGYEGMEVGKSMSTPLENAWVAQAEFTNKGRGPAQEEKEKKEGAKETAKTPEQVQEISACYRRAMRLTGEELGTRCALLVSLANDVDATPDLLGDIGHIFGSLAANAGKFREFASCFSAANGCSVKVTKEGHAAWMAGFPTLEKHHVMTDELGTAMEEMADHVRRDQAARGVPCGASGGGGGLAELLAMLASQS
jgi:hypothetical protein